MNFFDTLKPLDNLGYNHSYEDYEYQLELIKKAQTGDEQALEELIIINKGLIINVAIESFYYSKDRDDIIQEAIEAFIKAVYAFNTSSNTRFSTYVSATIRNKLSNYVRDTMQISVPRYKIQELKKYKKARTMLFQQLNREPTIQEISNY